MVSLDSNIFFLQQRRKCHVRKIIIITIIIKNRPTWILLSDVKISFFSFMWIEGLISAPAFVWQCIFNSWDAGMKTSLNLSPDHQCVTSWHSVITWRYWGRTHKYTEGWEQRGRVGTAAEEFNRLSVWKCCSSQRTSFHSAACRLPAMHRPLVHHWASECQFIWTFCQFTDDIVVF